MSIDFELAKKYAADKLIKQALKYLEKDPEENFLPVSYTHLTLPTNREV